MSPLYMKSWVLLFLENTLPQILAGVRNKEDLIKKDFYLPEIWMRWRQICLVDAIYYFSWLMQSTSTLLLEGFFLIAVKFVKNWKYLFLGLVLFPFFSLLCSFCPFLSPFSCFRTFCTDQVFTVSGKRQSPPDLNAPPPLLQTLLASCNFRLFLYCFWHRQHPPHHWVEKQNV